jgi:hypothetical protein
MTKNTYRPLTTDELDSLRSYASQNGRTWKQQLSDDWYYARLTGPLHVLRNDLGPSWLVSFNLKKAVAAAYPQRVAATPQVTVARVWDDNLEERETRTGRIVSRARGWKWVVTVNGQTVPQDFDRQGECYDFVQTTYGVNLNQIERH